MWLRGPESNSFLSSLVHIHIFTGPCRVTADNETKYHPESWNEIANVFFVDQPIGTGFSYAEYGESVSTTEEAAKDIAAFIAIFFEHFTKFKGRALHMAGESYGGRYIPLFASAVYDQNTYLENIGMESINLKSIMIGNGMTDSFKMAISYYDMVCTSSGTPILDISTCVRMRQAVPRCEAFLKQSCIDQFDMINCAAANHFCNSEIQVPFMTTGRNPYDYTKMCEGDFMDTLCYPVMKTIANYLNQNSTLTTLGIDPNSPAYGNYSVVSFVVNAAFEKTLDEARPTYFYVEQLLHRGVNALIYVGANDWICNWIGNLRWVRALEYGDDAFGFTRHEGEGDDQEGLDKLREWGGVLEDDGEWKKMGMTARKGGLTFATIDGAGHTAPYDKPKESLELLKRWLDGKEL
ncbi:alpha/beta-hydrolase [Dendrothele bispora CBS 962.96]|uniref:Carboxypeptidase n=1 Tax=Dendrothele bispora (strain CBS 962.96) TaxID=1314807 RepID=A0A4S8KQ40_DENBC|nr:alpha/beta-hydrolase [Dendrothele bispora CBS 962.96]